MRGHLLLKGAAMLAGALALTACGPDVGPCSCEESATLRFAVAVPADIGLRYWLAHDEDASGTIDAGEVEEFWSSADDTLIGMAVDDSNGLYVLFGDRLVHVADANGDGSADGETTLAIPAAVSGPVIDGAGRVVVGTRDAAVRLLAADVATQSTEELWVDDGLLSDGDLALATGGNELDFVIADPVGATIWALDLADAELTEFYSTDDSECLPRKAMSYRTSSGLVWIPGPCGSGSILRAVDTDRNGRVDEGESVEGILPPAGGCSFPMNVGIAQVGDQILWVDDCDGSVQGLIDDEATPPLFVAPEDRVTGLPAALAGPRDPCHASCG